MYGSYVYILVLSSMTAQCVDFGMLRGVSPNLAAFYNPSKEFTCFDGLARIPFKFVNDDYCDCLDGSDEPGTAACENSSFHCLNAGFTGLKIVSSRVNDGICDCCDGSDEWLTNHCQNHCGAMSEAARLEAMDRAILLSKGSSLRQQMIQIAGEYRLQNEERLRKLEEEKSHAEKLKEAAETQMNRAGEAESAALQKFRDAEEQTKREKFRKETKEDAKAAHNAFADLDSNHNDLIELQEIKAKPVFDHDKNGLVTDEEIMWYINLRTDEVSEQMFQDSIWPHIRHLYVKRSIEKEVDRVEERGETEDNVDDEDKDKQKANEDEEEPSYDSKTQQAIDDADEARARFEAAKSSIDNIQHEIEQIRKKLEMDYGPEDEYAPLDGQCFSFDDREYLYTLCPFVQVTQASKSGKSETTLGHWGHWLTGEDDPVMVYDKGQSCWKGPQRSTVVYLECGNENIIASVAEPNKCEYRMHFKTPAACRLRGPNDHADHEEL